MSKLVQFSSVSKIIGKKTLLQDINFSLDKAEITTLIGQNGVGKTTLARIMLGLEPHNKGSVYIAPNIKISYVPQKLDISFTMPLSSIKLLEILTSQEIDSLGDELYHFIPNFDAISNKDISELSGGELQKLLLFGTISGKPDLLILDEPAQYLDLTSQKKFYVMINELKKQHGTTIFMISHDLFTVMKSSDQVICLNKHICCSGKPAEVESNADFRNALSEIGLYVHNHDHTH